MTNSFKYQITGKVTPERVDFNCSLPPMKLLEPTYNFELEISMSILKSQISIQISSQKEIKDFSTLRNIVRDFIYLHTDAFGYLHGYAYDIEITAVTGESNIPHFIRCTN